MKLHLEADAKSVAAEEGERGAPRRRESPPRRRAKTIFGVARRVPRSVTRRRAAPRDGSAARAFSLSQFQTTVPSYPRRASRERALHGREDHLREPRTFERTATFTSGDPGANATCTRSVFSPSGPGVFPEKVRGDERRPRHGLLGHQVPAQRTDPGDRLVDAAQRGGRRHLARLLRTRLPLLRERVAAIRRGVREQEHLQGNLVAEVEHRAPFCEGDFTATCSVPVALGPEDWPVSARGTEQRRLSPGGTVSARGCAAGASANAFLLNCSWNPSSGAAVRFVNVKLVRGRAVRAGDHDAGDPSPWPFAAASKTGGGGAEDTAAGGSNGSVALAAGGPGAGATAVAPIRSASRSTPAGAGAGAKGCACSPI